MDHAILDARSTKEYDNGLVSFKRPKPETHGSGFQS